MIKTYGTPTKDKCPSEEIEMASFFNYLRRNYPETWGLLALHIRNEGLRTPMQIMKIKAEGGFVTGAPDIIIPGSPTFVCELKSRSKTARTSKGQQAYLTAAHNAGCFVCVALGAVAAVEAFQDWLLL